MFVHVSEQVAEPLVDVTHDEVHRTEEHRQVPSKRSSKYEQTVGIDQSRKNHAKRLAKFATPCADLSGAGIWRPACRTARSFFKQDSFLKGIFSTLEISSKPRSERKLRRLMARGIRIIDSMSRQLNLVSRSLLP